jgi:hypothetical protein
MRTTIPKQPKAKLVSTPSKHFTRQAENQRRSDIQRRAQELYELRGKVPGREVEDWLQAEREVIARSSSKLAGLPNSES